MLQFNDRFGMLEGLDHCPESEDSRGLPVDYEIQQ